MRQLVCWAMLSATLFASAAQAALTAVSVEERRIFAEGKAFGERGAYETLRGRLTYAIDPADPRNALIADITRAPVDTRGRIAFTADFLLLRPVDAAKASGRLVYEVTNRGNLGILSALNDARPTNDPKTADEAGNGFLFERGDAILWSGWNWDVEKTRGQLGIDLPIASESGKPITGMVAHEIIVAEKTATAPISPGTIGYALAAGADAAATLTKRARPGDERQPVQRAQWRLQMNERSVPKTITLDGGFEPGIIYELVYEARDPVVVGLGLVAIRDLLDAVENGAEATGPLGRYENLMIFGNSQSARVINTMLALGLANGRDGTPVFDAAFILAGGAGKGGFNHRFAQTTRHFSQFEELIYPTDEPPFATSGAALAEGSLLSRIGDGEFPKLIVAGGSTDYWTRAMSLVSTTSDGTLDERGDRRARLFLFSGAPHGAGQAGVRRAGLAHCNNPLDFRPAVRALYVALAEWAFNGVPPPGSRYPNLVSGALIDLETYRAAFPKIPGVTLPPGKLEPPVLDFGPRFTSEGIADSVPPRVAGSFKTWVPRPDSDGTDQAGLRLPDVALPLGTYTGWNPRDAASGLSGKAIGRWAGSFIPFARTEAEAKAAGDPRPSIERRYRDRARYESLYRETAQGLVAERVLLARDVEPMTARALAFYDRVTGRDPAQDAQCGFLAAP